MCVWGIEVQILIQDLISWSVASVWSVSFLLCCTQHTLAPRPLTLLMVCVCVFRWGEWWWVSQRSRGCHRKGLDFGVSWGTHREEVLSSPAMWTTSPSSSCSGYSSTSLSLSWTHTPRTLWSPNQTSTAKQILPWHLWLEESLFPKHLKVVRNIHW